MKTMILALSLTLGAQAQAGIKILSAKLNEETSKVHAVLESDNFCAGRAQHALELMYCNKRTDGPCYYKIVQRPMRIRIGCPSVAKKQIHKIIDADHTVASPSMTIYLVDDESNSVLLKQGGGRRCGPTEGVAKRCGSSRN